MVFFYAQNPIVKKGQKPVPKKVEGSFSIHFQNRFSEKNNLIFHVINSPKENNYIENIKKIASIHFLQL